MATATKKKKELDKELREKPTLLPPEGKKTTREHSCGKHSHPDYHHPSLSESIRHRAGNDAKNGGCPTYCYQGRDGRQRHPQASA